MTGADKPKVSVGMPVFNGENYVAEAIESILGQTFSDIELIITDNASTDRTADICQDFANSDSRVHYYRNAQNLGATQNYNKCFELARGELFKWAAHDDNCEPQFIERCVGALASTPEVVLAYTCSVIIDGEGNEVKHEGCGPDLRIDGAARRLSLLYRLFQASPWLAAVLVFGVVRTDVLRRTRLIQGFPSSDIVLLTELALLGHFIEIPDRLFHRRVHDESLGARYNAPRTWRMRKEIGRWFDSRYRTTLLPERHQVHVGQYRAIAEAPLSFAEKCECVLALTTLALRREPATWASRVKRGFGGRRSSKRV